MAPLPYALKNCGHIRTLEAPHENVRHRSNMPPVTAVTAASRTSGLESQSVRRPYARMEAARLA
jgi:hypothetical protein